MRKSEIKNRECKTLQQSGVLIEKGRVDMVLGTTNFEVKHNNTALEKRLNCQWCGNLHSNMKCPLITGIEYYPDGTIKSITFISGLVEGESLISLES